MAARRWVYSVIRHIARAKWRHHAQSGLPEEWAAQIAVALAQDQAMLTNVVNMSTGNSETGADVWTRMSRNVRTSLEYQFVGNYELPDDISARIRQAIIAPGTFAPPRPVAQREQTSGWALALVAMLALVATAVCFACAGIAVVGTMGTAVEVDQARESARREQERAAAQAAESFDTHSDAETAAPAVAAVEADGADEQADEASEAHESETSPEPNNDLRTWTSTAGTTIEAEFVSMTSGKVKLRKADGLVIVVEVGKLSDADRDWLKERARRARNR